MTKKVAEMTPEEKAKYDEWRKRGAARNREKLRQRAAERRAAGKCKGTTYYRNLYTPEQQEAERAYKRAHYQETRDQQLAYAAAYREANYGRLRASWTGAYQRRKAYFVAYRERNYERIRAQRAVWSAANAERIKALNAAWTQNNLDRHRLHQHKRRARLKAGGSLSLDIIEKLLVRQKARCACCGQRLRGEYHLDHIVPLALGGRNVDENVQLLTPRCNLQKGAKDPVAFMQRERGMLL